MALAFNFDSKNTEWKDNRMNKFSKNYDYIETKLNYFIPIIVLCDFSIVLFFLIQID